MDPLETVAAWLEEARSRGMPEPEAMALATATPDAWPSVRVVLCRGIDARGLRFFTNYVSRKGIELERNPRAAAVLHWPVLTRQVRVEGLVERLSADESDAYFARRPRGHRLSAWASAQSRPVEGLDELRRNMDEVTARYAGQDVPRPPHWGGFLLRPLAVELWTQGPDRLHERLRYARATTGASAWDVVRLSP
jgi:pyridoxamine 5'-phosphate oxidase